MNPPDDTLLPEDRLMAIFCAAAQPQETQAL